MELRFDHTLARELARVEAALLHPDLAPALARRCPALAEARVTRFRAASPPVAWTERVRWSRAAHAGRFAVTPELPAGIAGLVRCEGTYALAARPDGATRRRVEGVLSVRAPLVGPLVEARVAAMLGALFDAEAALLVEGVG